MGSLGLRVTVVDDNPKMPEEDRFAAIEVLLSEDMESYAGKPSPDSHAYIVTLTWAFQKTRPFSNASLERTFAILGWSETRERLGPLRRI